MFDKISLAAIILISTKSSCFVGGSLGGGYSCKDIEKNSKELQLKNDLLCDYDPIVRPTIGKNKTLVKIVVGPKFVELDDFTNIFTVHAWTFLYWDDPFLVWNPEDYEGIKDTVITHEAIWVPDLALQNSAKRGEDELGIGETNCLIMNEGRVRCIEMSTYAAHCDSNYENYPYDVHNCTLEIASWTYNTKELGLWSSSEGADFSGYYESAEWDWLWYGVALKKETSKLNETYSTHVYELAILIQRNSVMRITFVVTAFVFVAMNLFVLWLDCHSKERIILICLSFMCHLLGIHDLYAEIPFSGRTPPKILRLYESSFVLTTFALILTVLLRELRRLRSSPPEWINSITRLTLQSRAGQLLLLSILDPKASAFIEPGADDSADLVNGKQKKRNASPWSSFVLIVGWFAFVSVLLAYSVLLALYMPALRQHSWNKTFLGNKTLH